MSELEGAAKDEGYVLTISCPDRRGIVAAVTTFLFDKGCNIVDSAQFGDRANNRFFLRIRFVSEKRADLASLTEDFTPIAADFAMEFRLHDMSRKTRTLIMVSKFGHCLVDLLYRHRIGSLPIDIIGIVSNHHDFEDVAAAAGIPFHYLPVDKANKATQEARLLELIDTQNIELVVLARYMQILSETLTRKLKGKAINIHHSFLPSFKGARPYHQAYERGVKLIGATAHFVTPDLDEGPIIEQAVERVSHALSPDDYVAVGRDAENIVLARAVKWYAEHRILLNENRTIIFG